MAPTRTSPALQLFLKGNHGMPIEEHNLQSQDNDLIMALPIRVAACHAAPVFLSAHATTNKCIALIEKAARHGANMVVFPETYISAFPIWSALRPPTDNHDFFKRMVQESVYADGEEIQSIRATAKNSNVMVSIGISEKSRCSSATLFNTNLLIGNSGEVLVHHRKLVPTFFEKLTWAPGDGHGLRVTETPFGNIGVLICGENTNPLARYALMSQGEQIHISTWPAIWPTRTQSAVSPHNQDTVGSSITSNAGSKAAGPANYDNVAANRTRAAAHCFEAKCFGVLCSGLLGRDAIDAIAEGSSHLTEVLEQSQRGATMFLDPTGALLPGFTVDDDSLVQTPTDLLQSTEDILYADMDVTDCIEGKQYHDVTGGYQRLDVFELKIDRTRRHPSVFTERPDPGSTEKESSTDGAQ